MRMIQHLCPGVDLSYADPPQHLRPAGQSLDYVDRDRSICLTCGIVDMRAAI